MAIQLLRLTHFGGNDSGCSAVQPAAIVAGGGAGDDLMVFSGGGYVFRGDPVAIPGGFRLTMKAVIRPSAPDFERGTIFHGRKPARRHCSLLKISWSKTPTNAFLFGGAANNRPWSPMPTGICSMAGQAIISMAAAVARTF
ncbi:MAG: hypothetical protein MRJ52_03220 [Nitrosomonas sp.]|nr:hypothetical protein [Nitrosomonas sp.]